MTWDTWTLTKQERRCRLVRRPECCIGRVTGYPKAGWRIWRTRSKDLRICWTIQRLPPEFIWGIIICLVWKTYWKVLKKKKPRNLFELLVEKQIKRAKLKYSYESERIPYLLAGHYVPDFIFEAPNGLIYVECKGYFRPEDKRKLSAVKRQHPELDIRLLFYSKKLKDIKWCDKNGFRYAIKTIPREWFKGL